MIKQKEKIYVSFVLSYSLDLVEKFNELEQWIASYFEYYEIILVNNQNISQEQIKNELNLTSKDIMFLNLGDNFLKEQAIKAGIEFSKGDSVFIINSLQFDDLIEQLKKMYVLHTQGVDIVITGVKYSRITDQILVRFISKISGNKISPHHDLLFLVSKRAINSYTRIKSKIIPFTMALRFTGFSLFEFLHKDQHKNQTQMSKDEYAIYIMMFTDLLPNLAIMISLSCLGLSVLSIIYAIVMYIIKQNIVEGWTTLFLLISFGLSGVFMILSIVVRYLGLIGKEVQDSPSYHVKQITKL